MSAPLTDIDPLVQDTGRPWILIAAYDVSTGASSEGHVAFNILCHLCKTYRIVLVTRRNNKAGLKVDPDFKKGCPGVYLVGYDLPKWTSWWKRGARFYQAYAYLWQMTWPLALQGRTSLKQNLQLIHVLNFHNDSIPSLSWRLGPPVVWGPINHHEIAAPWRRTFWPASIAMRHMATFTLRRVLWRIDPFLKLHIRKSRVILSAGTWVNQRLDLKRAKKVLQRSQLGVNEDDFLTLGGSDMFHAKGSKELVCAGRLDWIKGIDLALEAMVLLPPEYRLKIIGKGPAEQRLRVLAVKLDVEKRVVFQPPVPRNALSAIYAQADIFLFTSAEEAGLVWVEALASGLPVVAFDGETEVAAAARHIPGIQLAKGRGARRAQVEGLAAAIKAAAVMPRDPGALRTSVLKHYGWDSLAATISEAYREAIRPSR
ncbi:MAG: hypothetical protein VR64_22865 [Desulfatitalea sp. BRH_c12]|nr:MAG: hypothetical protein VR64_22865 [Desulfatitalea sp. BRH_c12]